MYLTPGFRGLLNNLIYAEFFFFFFGWDKVDECIILLNYTVTCVSRSSYHSFAYNSHACFFLVLPDS